MVQTSFHRWLLWSILLSLTPMGSLISAEDDAQLKSLRQVWQTIHDVHWDRDLIKQRWSGILPEFEEQLSQAESEDAAREVIQSMIRRLEQSHFSIIPASVFRRQDKLGIENGSGTMGVEVRFIGGELVATKVTENGPAAAAGLKPGDRLDQIRKSVAEVIIERANERSEHEAGRAETFVGLLAEGMLGGVVGSGVSIKWTDAKEQSHEADIKLSASEGDFASFGNLPAVEVILNTDVLPDGVVYFQFSSFFNPVPLVTAMKELMETHSDAKGLILDVRGNRGGIVLLACGLSNWLSTEPTTIGLMKGADSELKLKLNPRKPHFRGKVVVLIDELSISSAEILAGGLQDASMATVIGTTSAGLVLPSMVVSLPSGDRFQYAISDFQTGQGRRLEGDGVTPDIEIRPTPETLRASVDPVLDRALQWIADE